MQRAADRFRFSPDSSDQPPISLRNFTSRSCEQSLRRRWKLPSISTFAFGDFRSRIPETSGEEARGCFLNVGGNSMKRELVHQIVPLPASPRPQALKTLI